MVDAIARGGLLGLWFLLPQMVVLWPQGLRASVVLNSTQYVRLARHISKHANPIGGSCLL